MRFQSVCSGIEAASAAWLPLGWECVSVAEIDPFASAVLAYRYPETPNLGDFTAIEASAGPINVLVGGTPCQSFSVAGLRGGMADARGNLALEFLRLAGRTRPEWVVWENVPGVLSSNGGRDFGAFLGGLAELGYGWSYRILDAQFFGLAQRRQRVFVVGHLGDWRRAAAVLLERDGLSGNPPPRREAGAGVTPSVTPGARRASGNRSGELLTVAGSQTARYGKGTDSDATDPMVITHALRADGFDASEDGTGRGTPLVAVAADLAPPLTSNYFGDHESRENLLVAYRCHGNNVGPMGTVRSGNGGITGVVPSLAYGISSDAVDRSGEGDGSAAERAGLGIVEGCSPALRARPNNSVATSSAVRRLPPVECERLMGFEDNHTLVPYRGKPAADSNRYKAIGNSMAVPVMRWIGKRIQMVVDMEIAP